MIANILYFSTTMDFKFARSAEMAISFFQLVSLLVVNRQVILKFRQKVFNWKFVRNLDGTETN